MTCAETTVKQWNVAFWKAVIIKQLAGQWVKSRISRLKRSVLCVKPGLQQMAASVAIEKGTATYPEEQVLRQCKESFLPGWLAVATKPRGELKG
jgi:hypothetical protein